MNLITRVKYLFGWRQKGGRKLEIHHLVPDSEVDAFMEKTINSMKKVPYVGPITGSDGDYNLRFSLASMVEDGDTSDHHLVKDVAPRTATADDIVKIVLAEISSLSKFSQDVKISFKMKSGWEGYIRVWLYPQVYYGEPSGHKTDFSEIYLVEKDPSFLHWKSVCYRNTNDDTYQPSYDIYLNTKDYWESYPNHYTGIWLVSWVGYYNRNNLKI